MLFSDTSLNGLYSTKLYFPFNMETGFTVSPLYKYRNIFACFSGILDAQFKPFKTIKTNEIKKTCLETESPKSKSNKI